MNTKHTPGPWKVITEATALEVDVFEVAEVSHFRVIPDRPDTWSSQGDAFADARLMAAAPELLVWLRWALDRLNESAGQSGQHDMARAVVAKATGEST